LGSPIAVTPETNVVTINGTIELELVSSIVDRYQIPQTLTQSQPNRNADAQPDKDSFPKSDRLPEFEHGLKVDDVDCVD